MSNKLNTDPIIFSCKYYPNGKNGNSYRLLNPRTVKHFTEWWLVNMYDGTTDWAYEKIYQGSYNCDEAACDQYEYGGSRQAFCSGTSYIFMGWLEETNEFLMLSDDGKIYRLPEELWTSFYSTSQK